jgi:hypothetical protein
MASPNMESSASICDVKLHSVCAEDPELIPRTGQPPTNKTLWPNAHTVLCNSGPKGLGGRGLIRLERPTVDIIRD